MRQRAILLCLLLAAHQCIAVWDEYAWTRASWDKYKFELPATFYKAAISNHHADIHGFDSTALSGARSCSLFGAHLDPPPAPPKPASLMCVGVFPKGKKGGDIDYARVHTPSCTHHLHDVHT